MHHSLLKLSPGLHILVHKIYLENFHVVLKCGKCQNNRQTAVDLLGLLTVYALEHRVEVHIIPFLASCVIFPMSSVDQKCPFSHSVRKSAEAWLLRSTYIVINRGQQYVVFSATLKNYTADNDFSNDQLFQELYPLCTSGTNKGRLAIHSKNESPGSPDSADNL